MDPARQLFAGIIGQAIADLKDPRYRKSARVWLFDAHGTCPGYCAAIDIAYDQFLKRVDRLFRCTVVRKPRKVKPTKRGRLRNMQRIALRAQAAS